MMSLAGAILSCALACLPMVHSGCGTHDRAPRNPGGPGPQPLDPRPQDEDVEQGSDSGEEQVYGPPTPLNVIEQLGLDPGRPQEPWEELMTVVGHLWDEGCEYTVYMMIYHLQLMARDCPPELSVPLRDALRMLQPYDDGVTRTRLPRWWSDWLDRTLSRWASRRHLLLNMASTEDAAAFVQTTPGQTRPPLWRDLLHQVREYPPGIQGVVSRRLRRWVREQLDQRGPGLVVLGGLLLDVEKEEHLHLSSTDEEREVGLQLGESMIAMLDEALSNGTLNSIATRSGTGLATRDAARDLATRADRADRTQQIPIDDSWGNALENEELHVGIALSRWLRRRLPQERPQRRLLFDLVVQGLRDQLAQECRHLRRLHMGLEHAYTMGVSDMTQAMDNATDDEMRSLARDYVDQIVMNIGQNTSSRTVISLLQEGASSSSSSGPPPRGSHGSLFQEGEALRRWLNGVFEGSLSTLMLDHAEDQEGSTAEAPNHPVEEEEQEGPGEAEGEPDEAALVQKPPWERGNQNATRRRPRSRSLSASRRTWSTASASGLSARRLTDDGNEHRPWRREVRHPTREESRPTRPSSASRRNHSDALATSMGPQAWHCLLEMRSPMDPVEAWGYGLPATSSANVEASYGAMTHRERQVMNLELLRVLSAILADIAQAMTTAMLQDQEEAVEEPPDGHADDGDEHSLVQTGLPPEKARKLTKASAVQQLTTSHILTSFDRVSRSLMAAMERMSSTTAMRCAQCLLNRLVAQFGTTDTFALPEDATALLSGLVSFGAELNGDHEPLDAMDRFFTDHWWEAILPTLPVVARGDRGLATVASSSSTTLGAPAVGVVKTETSSSGNLSTTSLLPKGAHSKEDPGVNATLPTQAVDTSSMPFVELPAGRDWQLSCDRTAEIDLDDSLPAEHGEEARVAGGRVEPASDDFHRPDSETRRAMEEECERYKSALLQDWEDEVLRQAMLRDPVPQGVRFVIQGGVLSSRGIRGHTQSMCFHLGPGEAVTLRMNVEGQGLAETAAPARQTETTREG